MILGERIEQRRKALGIKNHSALARLVGIPQSTMSGLIKNPYRWSPHLIQIAATLQTTVAYLTGATDDPDENAPPPAAPVPPVVMMSVNFPATRTLKVMFRALLAGIDPGLEMDAQAQLLAERLPNAFAQLQFARTDRPTPALGADGADPATHRLEQTK